MSIKTRLKFCPSELPLLVVTKLAVISKLSKGISGFLFTYIKRRAAHTVSYEKKNQINPSNGCEDENSCPGRTTRLWEGTKSSSEEVSDLKPNPSCEITSDVI